MANSTMLYAWATPAFVSGSPVDHTWVTTYDNRTNALANVAAVVAAKQDYWYCWGSFHPRGGTPAFPDGSLGVQAGSLPLARCLVQSNADSSSVFAARGTIFTYGIDGVCHQLANQVLYATGVGGAPALTVSNARGYHASVAVYGTYGLQHAAWRNKIAACVAATTPPGTSGRPAKGRQPKGSGPKMSASAPASPPDEFEQRVGDVLGAGRLGVAAQLLHLRAQFQTAAAAHAHAMVAPNADELNQRNQRFFDDAAKLLSPSDFEAIFGFAPGEKINLVLPDPGK